MNIQRGGCNIEPTEEPPEREREESERKGKREGEGGVSLPTSKSPQQDLLIERHGPLARGADHVPHGLVDGKSGQGIGHLWSDKNSRR